LSITAPLVGEIKVGTHGGGAEKLAIMVRLLFMTTVAVVPLLESTPVQELKTYPEAGIAFRYTWSPAQ
jgi:hypothetical protein